MIHIDTIITSIEKGLIIVPENIKSRSNKELKSIYEPVINYLNGIAEMKARSPRAEVLKFTNLIIENREITVFLVNLSVSGALLMVNTRNQQLITTQQGKLVIKPQNIVKSLPAAHIEVPFQFVRQTEGKTDYFFFGTRFVDITEQQRETIQTIVNEIS